MPKYEEKFSSHKAGSMSMIGKAKSEALKKKKESGRVATKEDRKKDSRLSADSRVWDK